MRISVSAVSSCLAAVLVAVSSSAAHAQPPRSAPPAADEFSLDDLPPFDGAPDQAPRRRSAASWTVSGDLGYQFGGSEFDVLRASAGVGVSMPLNADVDLSLGFRYGLDDYEFEGDAQLGPEPWAEVHSYGATARLEVKLDASWSLFAGPVFLVSSESGASFSESWIAGGFAGVSYRTSNLTIGAGLGAVSQLQDPARIYPVFTIDWEISNDLRLTNQSSVGRTGFELVFGLNQDVDIAFGVAYQFNRFRLDDDGIAPGGVGEESGLPVWFRATWNLTPKASVTGYVGAVFDGETKLETAAGGKSEADYDTGALVGLSARFKF